MSPPSCPPNRGVRCLVGKVGPWAAGDTQRVAEPVGGICPAAWHHAGHRPALRCGAVMDKAKWHGQKASAGLEPQRGSGRAAVWVPHAPWAPHAQQAPQCTAGHPTQHGYPKHYRHLMHCGCPMPCGHPTGTPHPAGTPCTLPLQTPPCTVGPLPATDTPHSVGTPSPWVRVQRGLPVGSGPPRGAVPAPAPRRPCRSPAAALPWKQARCLCHLGKGNWGTSVGMGDRNQGDGGVQGPTHPWATTTPPPLWQGHGSGLPLSQQPKG